MTLRFTTTDKISASSGVKCLGYSDAGFGKTNLCRTAPSPFIISAEAGLLSLRDISIPAVQVTTLAELGEVYEWVAHSKEAQQYWTICLDSLSEMAEVLLATLKAKVKDPRQAYGEMIDRMEVLIRAFRDLPNKHVYMSAKQEPMKDEMTGIVKYGPSMPGTKLGPKLPYFFDEVFCIRIGMIPQTQTTYRYLQTQPDMQFTAKDRSGSLLPIEEPNLTTVFNKILGV